MIESIVPTTGAPATSQSPPVLNEATYREWLEHLRPAPAELQWQDIPWRTSFWGVIGEARQQEKPILLWAMNGHPLACT